MIEKIFKTKHILPQAYKLVLDQSMPEGWATWEPEALWAEIERVHGTRPIEEVANKINAIKTLLTTELYYIDATVFENMILAANDLMVQPSSFQMCSPEELVYGIRAFRPIETRPQSWGREIAAYVNACCQFYGLLKYPAELEFAQPQYEGELANLAKQITIRYTDPKTLDQKDVVAVQSNKLYHIAEYTAIKLGLMTPEGLK